MVSKVISVRFSFDGKFIVLGLNKGQVLLVKTHTLEVSANIEKEDRGIGFAIINPQNDKLITGGVNSEINIFPLELDDSSTRIDTEQSNLSMFIHIFYGETDISTGKSAIAAVQDNSVVTYDIKTGEELEKLELDF